MSAPVPEAREVEILLQRARGGDAVAMEELFSGHRVYLRRLVELRMDPRLRQRLDVSDVVQEAEMEAARRIEQYLREPPMPFHLWLRRIAQDRLLMARRRHVVAGRRAIDRDVFVPDQTSVDLADRLAASGQSPSRHVVRQESARHVQEAIARLPEADREILLMRTIEGLSNTEAAQVLGIEPAAASKRYGRTLLRLRALLVRAGVTGSQV